MNEYEMAEASAKYVAHLRAVAAFYERNPDIPAPTDLDHTNYSVCSKEHAAAVVRALGNCRKEYDDDFFRIYGIFDGVAMRFVFTRSEVCKPVVVGQRVIPAEIVPEHVRPERVVDVIEWECSPILQPSDVEAAGA